MHCDLCGEDNLRDYLIADIRPYDIFCSHACIEQHKQDIANGEWSNHDSGLENYYSKAIKDNWKDLLITKENANA
jgi:hypothetical protein